MRYLILFALLIAGTAGAQTIDNDNLAQSASQSGAEAGANNQGVNLNAEFNSQTPGRQTFRYTGKVGNTPVNIAPAVSFAPQNCGNSNSYGISGGGWTVGGSKTTFSAGCEARLNAETFGKEAVNAINLFGDKTEAWRLHRMSVYAGCIANQQMADGCYYMGLIDQRTLEHIKASLPKLDGQKK